MYSIQVLELVLSYPFNVFYYEQKTLPGKRNGNKKYPCLVVDLLYECQLCKCKEI